MFLYSYWQIIANCDGCYRKVCGSAHVRQLIHGIHAHPFCSSPVDIINGYMYIPEPTTSSYWKYFVSSSGIQARLGGCLPTYVPPGQPWRKRNTSRFSKYYQEGAARPGVARPDVGGIDHTSLRSPPPLCQRMSPDTHSCCGHTPHHIISKEPRPPATMARVEMRSSGCCTAIRTRGDSSFLTRLRERASCWARGRKVRPTTRWKRWCSTRRASQTRRRGCRPAPSFSRMGCDTGDVSVAVYTSVCPTPPPMFCRCLGGGLWRGKGRAGVRGVLRIRPPFGLDHASLRKLAVFCFLLSLREVGSGTGMGRWDT